jgi:hypothetical protein
LIVASHDIVTHGIFVGDDLAKEVFGLESIIPGLIPRRLSR